MSTTPRTSTYTEFAPAAGTTSHVVCTWIGITGDDGGYTDRVLPDACVDVIWDGTRVFIAGPDTRPVVLHDRHGTAYAGVRLIPGHAPAVLGCPTGEITDQRVDAADMWGQRLARTWHDQLAGLRAAEAGPVLAALVAALPDRTEDTARTDAVAHLVTRADVAAVADEIGCTARTLHRRCTQAFGYGPKTLQRILRFQRFLSRAERDPDASLSRLAADSGYSDQPHLTRDCNELAGLAPRPLLLSRGVRSVQDRAGDQCDGGEEDPVTRR